MQSNYKEKAMPMISVNQSTGKYTFEQQALSFIKSVPGPIGVISVAGLYRTGKSYLLNRMLLNRSNGFGVGPTVNPCTKGLWCWGTPLKGLTNQGQTLNIIVIDTQGIGALDQDQTHDTRIFTLAILLSSCFIYNSVGSIDETAIQNLSLVVNLTKHIHLKSQSKSEQETQDTDPDEFANFFPSFYWVVRDFALKLEDHGGDAINSKEYLEKALALQKGFTDDVEEKNRIRRLLTAFFKQRECFTLVRPCIEEDKLRMLDKLGFEELRPQFVEQVMSFRRRVVNRMRPKIINGRTLTGQMYLSLIRNYVSAINDGAVPNIENAWNYMCRQQSYKISAEAYDMFEVRFKESLDRLPCSQQDFNKAAKYAKQQAFELFKKKAFGDLSEEFMKQLKDKVQAKVNQVKIQNQREAMSIAHQYIVRNFSCIQKKLKLGEYKSFTEFEKEMAGLYAHAMENGPKLPNTKMVYLEFLRKVLPQGADLFLRNSEGELQKIKSLGMEKEKNYERELKSLRQELIQQSNASTDKINTLDREKVEFIMKIQKLTEDLERTKKQREHETSKLSKSLQTRQSELENFKKTLQQKLTDLSLKNQDLINKLVTGEKQWEKQRALMEQKTRQLSIQCQELQKREKILQSAVNSAKSDSSFQLKENTLRYERRISELSMELGEYRDKSSELVEELKSTKEQLQSIAQRFQKRERKYKEDLSFKTKQLERMKQEIQLDRNRLENQCELAKEQVARQYKEITQANKRHELTIKSLTDQLKSQKSMADKQTAILKQKLGFVEECLKQARQQLQEAKDNHEAAILAMEQASGRRVQESLNERIIELKSQHGRNMKESEVQWDTLKRKMQTQLETLCKSRNELQLKVSLLENTQIKQKQERLQIEKRYEQRLQSLSKELSSQELTKSTYMKEQQSFYQTKIRDLERQLEVALERSSSEQRQAHSRSEQAITQLKNYYQLEKEKLESKLAMDREKSEKRHRKTVDEYEERLRNEVQALEEQNQQMKEEYLAFENTMQSTLSQLQHQSELKGKQLENTEKILTELKQTSTKRQSQLTNKYDALVSSVRVEKQNLFEKMEQLHIENNKKQKNLISLNHIKEQLSTAVEQREKLIENMKKESADVKAELELNIQEMKRKHQELAGEYLEKKIGYQKSIALASQECEFYSQKAKDLQRQLELTSQGYEQRLKSARDEAVTDLKAQSEKLQQERLTLQQKYEKIKKSSREVEANLQRQISEMDKQRAISQEKSSNLQEKLRQVDLKKTTQIQSLISQLASLKQSGGSQRKCLQSELQTLRAQCQTLQTTKSQLFSNYQKDRILWQNKITFLEQQRDQSKSQNSDKIRKLQLTIETLQRNRMNEKSSAQAQYNELISKLEKKYLTQISEINETNTKRTLQLETNVRQLQLQLKNANEKYTLELHAKLGNVATTEKRLVELVESEKRLQLEVDRMRAEKDERAFGFQKQLEQERQMMRARLRQMEDQIKNVQREKREKYFEYQRQMSKWKFEQANKTDKIQSLQQQVTRNAEELQKLQRQNERLRVQRKQSKTSGMTSFLASKWSNNYNPDSKANKSNMASSSQLTILDDDKQNIDRDFPSFRSNDKFNF